MAWSKLLDKYSAGNEIDKKYDEPMVTLRRNVFFSKRDEEKIKCVVVVVVAFVELILHAHAPLSGIPEYWSCCTRRPDITC